ncbi:MAG: rhodanese-related sulfurtransferase [Parachlamydiaceae bacterium]
MSLNNHSLENAPYWVLAYYHLVPLSRPNDEVAFHKSFFNGRDITCRIYISEQGINGQASGAREDAIAYISWMHSRPEFKDVVFKIHPYHENVFPRMTVKYKAKLVAIDSEVDFSKRGEHVSPKDWKSMLEEDSKKVLIDVRNDYEWKIGRFQGAELPQCSTFREFTDYADKLKNEHDPKSTPVMMYCTGGIRCELYSAILKDKGFEKIYQLDGGVIGYGLNEGGKHWEGKLFVFDDRLAIPISEEESPVIGTCHHCGTGNDSYYNCANMDCNELFLCCQECLKKHVGCCCTECTQSNRLRPYHEQNAHKPFRRWYHYEAPQKNSHGVSE